MNKSKLPTINEDPPNQESPKVATTNHDTNKKEQKFISNTKDNNTLNGNNKQIDYMQKIIQEDQVEHKNSFLDNIEDEIKQPTQTNQPQNELENKQDSKLVPQLKLNKPKNQFIEQKIIDHSLKEAYVNKQELKQKLQQINSQIETLSQHQNNKRNQVSNENDGNDGSQSLRKKFFSQLSEEEMLNRKQQIYKFIQSQKEVEKNRKIQQMLHEKKQQILKLKQEKERFEHIQEIQEKNKEKAKLYLEQLAQKQQERAIQQEKQRQYYQQNMKEKPLYLKFEENYNLKMNTIVKDNEKKLQEIKKLRQPVNYEEIKQHQIQYLRNRQMHSLSNQSSPGFKDKPYPHFYESVMFQKCEQEREESLKREQEKVHQMQENIQKCKQFAKMIKLQHKPKIDKEKANQLQEQIKKVKSTNYLSPLRKRNTNEEDQQKQIEQLKQLGAHYLEFNKQKKMKKRELEVNVCNKTDQLSLTVNSTSREQNVSQHKESHNQDSFHPIRENSNNKSERSLYTKMNPQDYQSLSRKQVKGLLESKNYSSSNLDEKVYLLQQVTDKLSRRANMQEQLLQYHDQSIDRDKLSDLYITSIKAKIALVQQNLKGENETNLNNNINSARYTKNQ